MVTQITPINLVPGTMIPRVNISQYDTGARVLKFQVYNGDSLFTFTNAMSVALVGTKPDGKGFSYTGTIASNMPTFDVTAQMSAVAGKVRAELVVFENGERCGSGNFVIFVEEGALGDGTDMSDSDYAIINDALEAAFDLDHFYADLQNMVTEAVEDIQVQQGQTVIDPTLTISGAAADAKATGDMARNFLEALMTETTTEAGIASIDDGAGGLPLKQFVGNIQPAQAGSGTPSPDNVRPITGYTGVTVTRTGRNLIDDNQRVANSSLTAITLGQTAGYGTPTIFTKAGTYTFSVVFKDGASGAGYVKVGSASPVGIWQSGGTHGTFTIESDSMCSFYVYNGDTPFASVNSVVNAQVELGTAATEYEPGEIATYPVTFPAAAGTVYGGTLTVNGDGSGTLVVDRLFVDLGNLNWSYSTRGYFTGSNSTTDNTIKHPASATVLLGVLCSQYPEDTSSHIYNAVNDNVIGVRNTTGSIWLRDTSKGTDPAAFKTAMNGVQFVYPVATPTTYALSAVQVAQMLQGVNNVWMDANGTVQVTYYANTALYVDKKIAELQALVLENQ